MPSHITLEQIRPLLEEHPAAMSHLAKALGLKHGQLRPEAHEGRLDASRVLSTAVALLDMLLLADAGQRVIDVDPDGAAFRLAIQQRLMLYVSEDGQEVRVDAHTGHHWTELSDDDPAAAMREAIVRCVEVRRR